MAPNYILSPIIEKKKSLESQIISIFSSRISGEQ